MGTSKLSKKYQITIPKRVREKIGLRKETRVSVEARNNSAVVRPLRSLVEKYKGMGEDVWRNLGGADEYLKKERSSWEKKS